MNLYTSVASNTGVRATLWERMWRSIETIAFARRYLFDCEKKIRNERSRIILGSMRSRTFQIVCILKNVNVVSEHQSLQPLSKKKHDISDIVQD